MFKQISFLIVLMLFSLSAMAQPHYEQIYTEGLEAYEKGDYSTFLDKLIEANRLRPNHRVILYKLATAYAVNKKPKKAMEVLEYRSDFYAKDDFSEDLELVGSLDQRRLAALRKKIEILNHPVQTSEISFDFSSPGYHPEGLVYSNVHEAFLIGDVRCGFIGSMTMDDASLTPLFDLKELGYWGAMGMAIDPTNDEHLWVSTSVLPNYCEFSEALEGASAILKINLKTGQLLQHIEVAGKHLFGDLIVSGDGTVYFTDSLEPKVYQIKRGTRQAELLIEDKRFWNLQGLALNEGFLFIADYVSGIYHFNMDTGEVNPISSQNQKLRGTDGLYYHQQHLYLLQNGMRPIKVSSIRIEDGYAIEPTLKILESGLAGLNEPTLGTIVEDRLYFIYNSPWGFYEEGSKPKLKEWPKLQIASMNLESK